MFPFFFAQMARESNVKASISRQMMSSEPRLKRRFVETEEDGDDLVAKYARMDL